MSNEIHTEQQPAVSDSLSTIAAVSCGALLLGCCARTSRTANRILGSLPAMPVASVKSALRKRLAHDIARGANLMPFLQHALVLQQTPLASCHSRSTIQVTRSLGRSHVALSRSCSNVSQAAHTSLSRSALPGTSSWWRTTSAFSAAVLGAALAAGAAVATASTLTALADAPSPPSSESKSFISKATATGKDSGKDDDVPPPLQVVRDVLKETWEEVQQELERYNAALPAGSPAYIAQQPQSSVSSTPQGQALEVVIPVRPGASMRDLIRSMRHAFPAPPGTMSSFQTYTMGTSQHADLDLSRSAAPDGSRSAAKLRAQLYVPQQGTGQAQISVRKWTPGAAGTPSFTEEELQGLSQLVRTCNLSFTGHNSSPYSRMHGFDQAPDLQALARDFQQQFLGPFMGGMMHDGMESMFQELERMMGGGMMPPDHDPSAHPGDQYPYPDQQMPDQQFFQQGPFGGYHVFRFPPGGNAGEETGSDGNAADQYPGSTPPGFYQQHGGARRLPSQTDDGHDWGNAKAAAAVKKLRSLGAQVFPPGNKDRMDWGILAGYEHQKRLLEDCLLLPLQRPEVYTQLAQATRATPGSSRPRAVLFEGPPGTGKTTSARVLSSQASVPLVYLPLEAVLSKWYGESEGQLATVFKAAADLGGAIIFIDELDAIGGSRDKGDMHEASRRVLSVMLREMDGFDATGCKAVVIGATNRKADLDPALLSRFDMSIMFGLPDDPCRVKILGQYAKQLSEAERRKLASICVGMSGRDLRDVCEVTERRWASKIIRGEVREGSLPNLQEYLSAAKERLVTLH